VSAASAIYSGRVSHARRVPRPHAFAYRLYLVYLDLDELPGLLSSGAPGAREGRIGPLAFRRADYLGDPTRDLSEEVRDRVQAALGFRPQGPVRLLTHLRSLGHAFNPVSFYFCFGAGGGRLEAVVAEITNTPWNERHAYVLAAGPDGATATFPKRFHVSPFFDMDQVYEWRIGAPGEELAVEMVNRESGREVFRARLGLRRTAWSLAALRRAALVQPFMAWQVHVAIYWQALRLWLKRTPFFVHPAKRAAAAAPRSHP
jgi:uncharacterized protein